MVRRVSRWVSVMSVLALSSVSALVALPGPAGAGFEVVEANCELPAERLPGSSVPQQELVLLPALCTEVEVTKVVTGEPAPGTTFDVVVECELPLLDRAFAEGTETPSGAQQNDLPVGLVGPFTETLTFGEEGGTQTLLVGGGQNCTVTEDPPAGCDLVNINPEEFDILLDVLATVVVPLPGTVLPITVTNDCPVEPDPITEVIEVPVEVPAAAPVAVAPRFTG